MTPRPDRRALAALLAVQALFGIQYVAAKRVMLEIPPPAWALVRAGSAAAILFLIVPLRREKLPRRPRLYSLMGLAVLGVALNQWLFVEGLHRTIPSHSALINATIPVVVLGIAVALGRERPTGWRVSGMLVTLAGVLLLVGPAALADSSLLFQGDVLTFCNAISYSLFLVLGKPVLERERTLPATALLLGFGALWLLPVGGGALARLPFSTIHRETWELAALIVLGPTIGAYALNTYAIRRVEASVVALFVYLQPLIATALSVHYGHEQLSVRLALSALVVFGGIFLSVRSGRALEAAVPEP